jgi:hypothetical protein
VPANKRHNPARFTSWEIHPVYNIEVCKIESTSSCSLSDQPDGFLSITNRQSCTLGQPFNAPVTVSSLRVVPGGNPSGS